MEIRLRLSPSHATSYYVKLFACYNIRAKRFLQFETSYRKEVLVYRISYRKDVFAVVTSNSKEVLAAWRIQVQATRKKPQEVVSLRTQKEVLARALFLGCTIVCWVQPVSVLAHLPEIFKNVC